ncbi:MAG: nuclear transport factor 2 family protein [Candidatus Rokuibacteriota bacterium]
MRHFVSGDRGVSEWTFRGTRRSTGEVVERQGCDVFTLHDGRIQVKDTYHKWRRRADSRSGFPESTTPSGGMLTQ